MILVDPLWDILKDEIDYETYFGKEVLSSTNWSLLNPILLKKRGIWLKITFIIWNLVMMVRILRNGGVLRWIMKVIWSQWFIIDQTFNFKWINWTSFPLPSFDRSSTSFVLFSSFRIWRRKCYKFKSFIQFDQVVNEFWRRVSRSRIVSRSWIVLKSHFSIFV